MNFGTIQSIMKTDKSPVSDDAFDPQASTDFDMGDDMGDDLPPEDFPDEMDDGAPEDKLTTLMGKLRDIKQQIDDIFVDMGYDAFSDGMGDDEFDGEFDDTLDADMGDDGDELDGMDFSNMTGDTPDGETDPLGAEPGYGNDETDELGDMGDMDGMDGMDDEDGDPDYQGNIRTVTGANLVYKRKQEDGNYEELWIYNVGDDVKKEMQIRRAILAGTDIAPNQRESEDGTQHEETSTLGNVQYLKVTGLPN